MKAYKHLVRRILANNHRVSVWNNQERIVSCNPCNRYIINGIETTKEAYITIHDHFGEVIGWAFIQPNHENPDRSVTKWSYPQWFGIWRDEGIIG